MKSLRKIDHIEGLRSSWNWSIGSGWKSDTGMALASLTLTGVMATVEEDASAAVTLSVTVQKVH